MTSYKPPICLNCKHRIDDSKKMRCEAFKKQIPDEIWSSENDHSKPLSDQDNDIIFEPIEDEEK